MLHTNGSTPFEIVNSPVWEAPSIPLTDDSMAFDDLGQNFPNPFNPDTWIPYAISQEAKVTIQIFGTKGQLVRTLSLGTKVPGQYFSKKKTAYWDGRNDIGERVATGTYFYYIKAGDFHATRKMVILK